MSKRKREEEIESEISRIQNQAIRIKVSRLRARFDNGVQQLTSQLKLARGFDRQKMTRRIKQAGDDPLKLERLDAEVQVLKGFNERKIARNYLLKQCVKTKRIAEAEAFKTLFAGFKLKPNGSVAEGNVLGRLFKSQPVSEILPGIMKGIREVVGADKPPGATIEQDDMLAIHDAKKIKHDPVFQAGAEFEDLFEGFSDAKGDSTLAGSSDEDESMESHESRLAGSSDNEDDSAERDVIDGLDHDRDQDSMEITTDEEEVDDDATGSLSSDVDDTLGQLNSQAKTPNPTPSLSANTSFLPSLMHGGYYSGSDDDDDDNAPDGYDPDKAYAAAAAQPRKNRRGQRARQAIAEKKHGTRAKHLVKVNGAEGVHGDRQRFIASSRTSATSQGRASGWDPKRGAIDSSRASGNRGTRSAKTPNRSERRNGLPKGGNAASKSTGGYSAPLGSKLRTMAKSAGSKNEKLHPSWEAARKRKLESASAGPGSFAGKKITFD